MLQKPELSTGPDGPPGSYADFPFFYLFTAPFNNMRNLKFKSPPTVAFFPAVNQNLNICMLAINGP